MSFESYAFQFWLEMIHCVRGTKNEASRRSQFFLDWRENIPLMQMFYTNGIDV